MPELLSKIRTMLPPRFLWGAAILVFSMAFAALLALAALALVMPLASAVAAPELLHENPWLSRVYEFAGSPPLRVFVAISALGLILFFLLKNLFAFSLAVAQTAFAKNLCIHLAGRLYRNYVRADYSFHLAHGASDLMARISQMRDVAFYLLWPLFLTISECFVFAAILCVVVWMAPVVALAAFLLSAAVVLVFHVLFRRRLDAASKELFAAAADANRTLNQSFAAIREVKLSGSEEFFARDLEKAQGAILQADKTANDLGQIPRFSLECFVVLLAGALIATLVWLNVPASSMILCAAFFVVAMFRLIPSVSRIQYNLVRIRGMKFIFDRLAEDLSGSVAAPEPAPDPSVRPRFAESLKFDRVSFRYSEDRPPVLQDFSFEMGPADCVAVVGRTGAGKSTLADLAMGFLTPQEGAVLADGLDIRSNLPAWRSLIGYVPQNICLFDDTIRANVAFGVEESEIDVGRVQEVLRLAQLDSFVDSLPEGDLTRIGPAGLRVSGGQRQRLAVARALYRAPRLLILDEATSALDDETEQALIDALNALKGRLAILMIAHRSSCIDACDRVISLDSAKKPKNFEKNSDFVLTREGSGVN